MDLTMEHLDDHWYANSGVLIEYGLLVGRKSLKYVFMFCEESTDRDRLPPLIPRTEVTTYSPEDRDGLKKLIRGAIEQFKRESPERERRIAKMADASRTMFGYLLSAPS
jgi:hypothetical protein